LRLRIRANLIEVAFRAPPVQDHRTTDSAGPFPQARDLSEETTMTHSMLRRPRWLAVMLVLLAVGLLGTVLQARPRVRARVRPKPAVRPRRFKKAKVIAGNTKVPLRRLTRVRPVVYRRAVGGGVVVVDDSGDVAPPQTGGAATEVTPVDADDELAEYPAYEVASVDAESLAVMVKVEGEDVPVRLIGVAPIQLDADPDVQSARVRPTRSPTEISALFLENLLAGEKVHVVYDSQVEETDEDENVVAYLYRAPDGLLVNMEVVRQGFAAADPRYDYEERESMVHYHQKAIELDKGMWKRLSQAGANRSRFRDDQRQ